MFKRKINLNSESADGLILGYEIKDKAFKPVLELASKGDKGWKTPIFIQQLINDPTPLLLREKWFYDKTSILKAFDYFDRTGLKGTGKLRYIFKESKRFVPINLEEKINSYDDIDMILSSMERCDNHIFRNKIKPLEKYYGNYATPNNYEFERMNAGIIRVLSNKFPNITPLDDTLRAPVYEFLGNEVFRNFNKDEQNINKLLKVNYNPLIPLPKLEEDWNPKDFLKLFTSKGADQLREIIFNMRNIINVNESDITRMIDNAKAIVETFSPTREIVYAFASLGSSIFSATQSVSNPIFYIPIILCTILNWDQFYRTIGSSIKKNEFEWIKVIDKLAEWKEASNKSNMNG